MTVLHGVELNILDAEGHVDLTERVLAEMDIGIASMHLPCYTSGGIVENTKSLSECDEKSICQHYRTS